MRVQVKIYINGVIQPTRLEDMDDLVAEFYIKMGRAIELENGDIEAYIYEKAENENEL